MTQLPLPDNFSLIYPIPNEWMGLLTILQHLESLHFEMADISQRKTHKELNIVKDT